MNLALSLPASPAIAVVAAPVSAASAPAVVSDRAAICGLRLVRIGADDRDAVSAHFLRLCDADRRTRFLRTMSDEAIRAHVDNFDAARDQRFALVDSRGSVVALGEGFGDAGTGGEMEVAFTTDEPWRRLGLAKCLWMALAGHACASGAECLVVHCDSRNLGMRRLLASVGAATQVDDCEVSATWQLGRSPC